MITKKVFSSLCKTVRAVARQNGLKAYRAFAYNGPAVSRVKFWGAFNYKKAVPALRRLSFVQEVRVEAQPHRPGGSTGVRVIFKQNVKRWTKTGPSARVINQEAQKIWLKGLLSDAQNDLRYVEKLAMQHNREVAKLCAKIESLRQKLAKVA